MMKKPTIVLFAGVFLCISFYASADNGEAFKIEHPYIQVSAGGSIGENENYAAFRLSGGADLSERFGVEAGVTTITDIFFTDIDIFYLSLVARYPIGEKMRIAGKVGVLSWDSRIQELFAPSRQEDGVNAMLGVEVQYYLFTHLALVLSLDYYGSVDVGRSVGNETIFPGSIGLRYVF